MNESKNLALYIIFNDSIEIPIEKVSSQTGHAILRYLTGNGGERELLDEYLKLPDNDRTIIALKAPIKKLIELETQGFPTQRDRGLTVFEPNTLTCVCYGVLDRNKEKPKFIKRFRLFK